MLEYKKTTDRFLRDTRGATAIEYCMCAMFVAVAAVGAVGVVGTTGNNQQFALITDGLTGKTANSNSSPGLEPAGSPATDPIQTGSTTPQEEQNHVAAAEPEEERNVLPQIYISSQAAPSCTSSTFNASCRPTLSVEAIEGWKNTFDE